MAQDDAASLDRLRAQRAALADFGLHAFNCNDIDVLLHEATKLVSEALQVDLVKVLEHRPETHDMLIRSGVNWQPGVVGHEALGDDCNSPAGYALKAGEPVISRDLSSEDRFDIPELLIRHNVKSMVNVIIAGGNDAFGVLEVDAQEHREFDDDDIAFLRNYANLLSAAIERIRSQDEIRKSSKEQEILARELAHRIKNLLSIVQAIALRTIADGRTAQQFREMFIGRLRALSIAENLVFENRGDVVDPRRIAEAILQSLCAERPEAVTIEGEPGMVPSRTARMLGLALHELATNAAKYGALSVPTGRIRIEWQSNTEEGSRHLTMLWAESGGPKVEPPERKGFGTLLLDDVVSRELDGASEITYKSSGLQFRLSFPV